MDPRLARLYGTALLALTKVLGAVGKIHQHHAANGHNRTDASELAITGLMQLLIPEELETPNEPMGKRGLEVYNALATVLEAVNQNARNPVAAQLARDAMEASDADAPSTPSGEGIDFSKVFDALGRLHSAIEAAAGEVAKQMGDSDPIAAVGTACHLACDHILLQHAVNRPKRLAGFAVALLRVVTEAAQPDRLEATN